MKNIILDASNLLHRTYHTSKGNHYEHAHVLGVLNYLKSFVTEFSPDGIYFCWDESEHYNRDNFRYDLIQEYKAQRNREEAETLHQYDRDLYEFLSYLGCYNLFPKRLECDDIIAWLCLERLKDQENIVISSDKDFLQLINYNENVKIYSPNNKILIDRNNFQTVEKIHYKDFLRAKVIMGDSSDNIRGIYGYGPVKSKKAAKDWKNFTANLDSDNKTILANNIKMMDLRRGYCYYPDEPSYYENQLEITPELNMNEFFSKCSEMHLRSITHYKDEWSSVFNRFSFENSFSSYFN